MNENYYIYYIIPDSNYVSETETKKNNNSSTGLEQVGNFIKSNIYLILLLIILLLLYKL